MFKYEEPFIRVNDGTFTSTPSEIEIVEKFQIAFRKKRNKT